MGYFKRFVGTISAGKAIQRLQSGQSQVETFSASDLVNMLVNLNAAASRLSKEDYARVYSVYLFYKEDTKPRQFTYDTYLRSVDNMILAFDRAAPFDEYAATPELVQRLYEAKQ